MNRLASFVILIFSAIFFLLSFYGSHGLLRLKVIDGDIVRLQRTAADLDAEIARLKGEIQAVGRDNDLLEQKAREELGLARPDEVVYVFPSEAGSGSPPARDAQHPPASEKRDASVAVKGQPGARGQLARNPR